MNTRLSPLLASSGSECMSLNLNGEYFEERADAYPQKNMYDPRMTLWYRKISLKIK